MKKIIFIIFGLVVLSSCQKEYVDPDQKPRATPSNTFHPEKTIPLHKDNG